MESRDAPTILGWLNATAVAVQSTGGGQEILVGQGDTGQHLALLLGSGKAENVQREDCPYWRIVHDRQVDHLLVELIDVMISIRYAHPTMVQLEMVLEPDRP
jgi:hypothetical protein